MITRPRAERTERDFRCSICHQVGYQVCAHCRRVVFAKSSQFTRVDIIWYLQCRMKRLLLSDELPKRAERAFIIWLIPHAGKMKRILRSDWLPDRAIGPILPAWDFPRWSRKKNFSFWPYNKSFIYKACSVFVCVFINLDSVSVNKNSNKELGQYPAILTSHLRAKYFLFCKLQIQLLYVLLRCVLFQFLCERVQWTLLYEPRLLRLVIFYFF